MKCLIIACTPPSHHGRGLSVRIQRTTTVHSPELRCSIQYCIGMFILAVRYVGIKGCGQAGM